MQTIGLIGGMSWESTQAYYRLINQQVRKRLGGLHSARLVLYSVDSAAIEAPQHRGDRDATAEILGSAAQAVEATGADFREPGSRWSKRFTAKGSRHAASRCWCPMRRSGR
jgi:aspartate racemase